MVTLVFRCCLGCLCSALSVTAIGEEKGETPKKRPSVTAQAETQNGLRFFETRIRPVLVKHCYECHSAATGQAKGGLQLDSREGIRQGGESGHAVVPGSVADSLIVDALSYGELEMPPKEQLPSAVIQDFRRWIQMGAPDPREQNVDGKSLPVEQVSRDLWSLKPLRAPTVPAVADSRWPINDIDRFVLAGMERAGIQPAANTDPPSMIRRLYFDLIGLPPSPEAIEDFERAAVGSSYREVVDKLLASRQFAERWARHWLDVARFAESNGRDRDVVYHEAWRYREYVIDAFDADMSYDRFVLEQLAGDLLPTQDEAERDRLLIATGFLAIGPKALSGKSEERRMDMVDEQIDVTTRSILGLTVACARCHDHKFDPIPTQDYYALAGIFRSTNTLYGPGIIQGQGKNGAKPFTQNLQQLSSVAPVDEDANEKEIERLNTLRDEAFNEQRRWLAKMKEAAAEDREPSKEVKENRAKYLAEQRRLEAEIAKLKEQKPEHDFAMAVCDSDKPSDCPVHVRGDVGTLGEMVPRGFVKAISTKEAYHPTASQSGRMELAKWLVDRENPLTARVAANRIWMHLMGKGIVGTPDNFGNTGEPPTDPELLDYLATTFKDGGWSTKKLVRAIVMSRTYRQSSLTDGENEAKDPENRAWGRHNVRRLDAESLRDAILFASGQLELDPPKKSLVAEMAGGEVGRTINLEPLRRDFPYRSVYLPILRSMVPEVLKVFDFAEPSIVVGRRSETNVPSQALFFLNSPFVMERADAMATRLLQEEREEARRVERAYLLTFARRPTAEERDESLSFIRSFAERLRDQFPDASERNRKAWSAFCQSLFATAEFRFVR